MRVGVSPLVWPGAAHGIDDCQQLYPHGRRLAQQEIERGYGATAAVGLDQPLDIPEHGSTLSTDDQSRIAGLSPGIVAYMPQLCYSQAMPKQSVHQSAVNALLSKSERAEHDRRVQALLSRNALLTVLEATREQQGMTKRELADRAGLDASSVRRLLTSETANPTTENAFRLMAAMGISLDATLPTGERVKLVGIDTQAPAAGRAAAA
jgi:ribosome-binding protein aMBF1 (putative translation factor)